MFLSIDLEPGAVVVYDSGPRIILKDRSAILFNLADSRKVNTITPDFCTITDPILHIGSICSLSFDNNDILLANIGKISTALKTGAAICYISEPNELYIHSN